MNQASKRNLEAAIQKIEKEHGKGSILRMGESNAGAGVEPIPTGSVSLDAALGIGGLPKGRIVEVFGTESSGKTTLALQVVAEAQKSGGMAAFIDAEHAVDPIYAANLGVKVDDLLVAQPDSGEQALQIAEVLVRSNEVSVIVIDSVAALVPQAELQGEIGDSHVGLQARLMSQALRKLTAQVARANCCVVFINQIREKVVSYGNPETTPGGRALKFYSSVRLDIRRIAAVKDGDNQTGNRTKVKVVKNKLAPPFKTAEFEITFGEGISFEGDLLDVGVAHNLVNKSGSWYSYRGERIGQGRASAKEFLKQNTDARDELELSVRQALGLPVPKGDDTAAGKDAPAASAKTASASAGATESGKQANGAPARVN